MASIQSLLQFLPFLSIASTTHSHHGHPPTLIPDTDFIHVDGLRLRDSHGTVHYLTGINYWSCMNLAAPSSAGGNYTRLTIELDQLASKGINHLRIMASSEGAPTPQPFRMNPPLLKAPGVYDEDVFKGLDTCLDEMSKRGIRATMTLGNEWHWSGGFAQFVSWANNDEAIPYPSSWNMRAAPQRAEPGTGWGNYTIEGVDAAPYREFTSFANRLYTDTRAEALFKDSIAHIMERRNSVNGRLYTQDPTIMTWQLANEPQAHGELGWEGPGEWDIYLKPNPGDLLFAWVERMARFVKGRAPRQLVSVGLESKQGEYYFKRVHEGRDVDYATVHCWVQNWGIYDMYDASTSGLQKAQDFVVGFITNTSKWATELGKPVFLEEFGMARDNWENKGKEYPYLSSANTTHKDTYFKTVISTVMNSFKSGGAYVGTAPWAYGGIWRPETQKENEFGMVWAGDPPHESPGWYDLYDTDDAMNIVKWQQRDIVEWIERHGDEVKVSSTTHSAER